MDGKALLETVSDSNGTNSSSDEFNEAFQKDIEDGHLEPEEKHESQAAMEEKLGMSYIQLLNVFRHETAYESVYFAAQNWRGIADLGRYGTTMKRPQIQLLLYAFLIKRSMAINVLQNEGFTIKNYGSSWTDDAFASLTLHVILRDESHGPQIEELPVLGRTLVVEDIKLQRAFTLVKDARMFFDVRRSRSHAIAWFSFPPAPNEHGDDDEHKFDIEWDLIDDSNTARVMRKDTKVMFDLRMVKYMTQDESEDTVLFDMIRKEKDRAFDL